MKKKIKILAVTFLGGLILGCLCIAIGIFVIQRDRRDTLHALMEQQIEQMERQITDSMELAYVLRALVIGADGADIDLNVVGASILHEMPVQNISIAPGGVVASVYPEKNNEAVLGLDLYSEKNKSCREALEARETGKLVMTAPYELVQGGFAISGRLEVYLPQKDGTKTDWGIVSVTLPFPGIMEDSMDVILHEGYRYQILLADKDSGEYKEVLNRRFKTGELDVETEEVSIQGMDFRIRACPISGWYNQNAIMIAAGIVLALVAVLTYYLQKILRKKLVLHEKATRDALTGLYNRGTGITMIDSEIASTSFRQGAFLLLDIDHFKQVNDTLGHQMGDRILQETAQILQSLCRKDDIVCRLGGDEFVVFFSCPDPNIFLKSKVSEILEKMCRNAERDGKTVRISCSIGVTVARQDGISFMELYKNADNALYHSKEKGRNCATFYRETRGK